MNKNVEQALTEGLDGGYAGKGEIKDVSRASFIGKSSHLEPSGEVVYHDEWFVPTYIGGGQELAKVGNDMMTRLYGGGTPSPEKLVELGTTVEEVGDYLKKKIVELKDKTRLFEESRPEADGDWLYLYEVLVRDPNIEVILAAESIFYKGTRVHLHPFIVSALK